MSKGDKRRGNRENKKPKKKTERIPATADFTKTKTPLTSGSAKKG